ncbi:MAG: ATP-binding protein [Archangiaceae bacterium]|nr:ATP-binding protein [Archangiaceae bacterium]
MFATSTPATAEGFFDRTTELARIDDALTKLTRGAPKWLCLVGPRKVGKTSLLREVERRSRRRGTPQPSFVVVDVLETMPASTEVVRAVAIQSVDALLSNDAGQALGPLATMPEAWRAGLIASPRFVTLPAPLRALLLELPGMADDQRSLAAMLSVPEQLAEALSTWVVVAIDEFQELATMARGGPDLMALLRSTWQRHRRTAYVVSGSARSTLLELATSQHSPFFQHFEVIEVGAFDEAFAVKLLVAASTDAVAPITEALARKLYRALGGNPFYLQVVGEAVAQERGRADAKLRNALQQTLFSDTGRLSLYFTNEFTRLVGRATTLAATLNALATGPLTVTQVATAIDCATAAAVGYLERLGDAVRRRDDGRWELADAVFGLWLEWRRPGGAVVPMRLVGDEAELAVAQRLAQLGFEFLYLSRGSRGPFDLLASRSARMLAVQVKRKPLPLRFTKAEWQRMQGEAKRYGWKWVVGQVERSGQVRLLDPKKARQADGVTLTERAAIDHPLAWFDE